MSGIADVDLKKMMPPKGTVGKVVKTPPSRLRKVGKISVWEKTIWSKTTVGKKPSWLKTQIREKPSWPKLYGEKPSWLKTPCLGKHSFKPEQLSRTAWLSKGKVENPCGGKVRKNLQVGDGVIAQTQPSAGGAR